MNLSTNIFRFFLLILPLFSQAQLPVPALRKQLLLAKTDTSKSRLCYELGIKYEEANLDSCFYFLTQSLQIAQRIHHPVATARAMFQLGKTYVYGSKDEAKAVYWLKQAIPVARASYNNACLADCYRLLAVCAEHQHIGNPEELMAKAVSYAKKANNWQTLTNTYQVYSGLYAIHKNYASAEKYAVLARVACQPYNLDNWFTSSLDLHDILIVQGKRAEAQVLARQLSLVKHKLPKTDGEFVYSNDVAKLEKILKHYDLAKAILLKGVEAEKSRSRMDTAHLFFLYNNLLDIFLDQKDWQNAYQYSRKLASVQLWLQHKRQSRDAKIQMTQVKAALDMENKEKEIALLAARQQQQQTYLIAAIVVAAFALLFLFILHQIRQRIERQKSQLGVLNATKDKLFAILSHDLRSPVANLQNNLMLTNWGALSQQEFADSTQDLTVDIGYVRTMLDNVLSWSISQMEGMKPRADCIAIAQLVEEQIQLLQPVANAKQIQILNQIQPKAYLRADKNHMAAIIRNLLQNALKFTHTGGSVWVGFSEREGLCQLIVQDTGIGMDQQRIENLFQLGKQPSRQGTAFEQGTGLGLVLVRELVEANQGFIYVVSEPGKGTTFTLTFERDLTKQKGNKQKSTTYV